MVGYYYSFEINRKQVRREVKQRIKNSVPEKDLVAIRVLSSDPSDLLWTKKDKEFMFKGEMYDIVRQELKNDTIIYHCIRDVKESKLFADLDKHVQKHMNDNPQRRKDFENVFKKLFQSVYAECLSADNMVFSAIILAYYDEQNSYRSINLDQLIPPPKAS